MLIARRSVKEPLRGSARDLTRALRGRAAERPLVENRATVAADLLLDLVRDPGVLAERMRGHGLVLVQLA
jgi:hypothetical protein